MNMNKHFLLFTFFFIATISLSFGQKTIEDFGYRQLPTIYQGDTVDILIHSKKGEENVKKPLFLMIQGSGSKPLIMYDSTSRYELFFFPKNLLEKQYHIAIINKTGIPAIAELKMLNNKKQFVNKKTNRPPKKYTQNYNTDYYTKRNNTVLDYLLTKSWIDSSKIVLAGHSDGSSIAVRMASTNPKITQLIYSGGTPYFSRIIHMIGQEREIESPSDSINWVEKTFDYWQNTLQDTLNTLRVDGWNSYKGTYSFSQNENLLFKKLTIPTLLIYGTKDPACPYNDMFRVEIIREGIKNIQFKAYVGLNHNYFFVNKDNTINYKIDNWSKITADCLEWIDKN